LTLNAPHIDGRTTQTSNLYHIGTAELTYRGLSKGRRHRKTDTKRGDNPITLLNPAQPS